MADAGKIRSMQPAARLAALCCVLAFAVPAHAADPIFPTGSRIGLVPPGNMTPSQNFMGFADPAKNAGILIAALPTAAYAEMEKTAIAKREPIEVTFGKGFFVTDTQSTDKGRYRKWIALVQGQDLTALATVLAPDQDPTYTDKAVRAALATLAVRATVPDAEQLSLLPFTVGDLAGFHVDTILPGRAGVVLIDTEPGSGDKAQKGDPTRFLIAAAANGPTDADRGEFARLSFDQIAGIKNVQITMSEPIRINSGPGFETVAEAKAVQNDQPVMVVQWLRFGGGAYLQMIGVVRTELWPDTFKRLRTMRDSIELKN
jgi:hypothetical protein